MYDWIMRTPELRRPIHLLAALALWALAACGGMAPPKRPVTQQRPLETLLTVAAYPNSDTLVLLITMQQLLASHREREGYDYFGKLAAAQPDRRPLFLSLQAVMQARIADDVPLLKRIDWVEDAMRKLEAGANADPLLGRLARGLVYAELPERFGKAEQGIADLEVSLQRSADFPVNVDRGVHRALAVAYRTSGDAQRSEQHLQLAGVRSLDDPNEPRVLSEFSVDAAHGFRFSAARLTRLPELSAPAAPSSEAGLAAAGADSRDTALVKTAPPGTGPQGRSGTATTLTGSAAEGVYVAEGFDFGNIAFIVGPDFVTAIDAGTTEATASAALAALRKITRAPIKYILLTHGHWDHVGGLRALREPGSTVITHANFPRQLDNTRAYRPPFNYFFGSDPVSLAVAPDRLVAAPERLRDETLDLELIPGHSGETDDALFIFDRAHDVLFVGDAFMPYVGAPFVAEGSARGFLDAIDDVIRLHPRRLVHGHPPLTAIYRAEVMPAMRDAFGALYEHSVAGARAARPLAEVLHDDFIPPSLRANPHAVLPYLVARDTFVQRAYAQNAGYWRADGEGIENFTRAEWSGALDALGGNSPDAFRRVSDDLTARGDAALALRIAELGLLRYPEERALQHSRKTALTELRELNSQLNPFRFIVYSEMAERRLVPAPAR